MPLRWFLPIPLTVLVVSAALPAAAQSRRGEMRGAWMGEGYNRDWPAIMKSLREDGFNALFPNFAVGDMAYYPSKVLPVAKGAAPGRDELAEAVKAAKQNGIELHFWRINWALWHVPQDIIAKLEAEGRLQRNAKGQLGRQDPQVTVDWLCPSNPENRKLEKEAMLEAVRRYDIAGIQFDYMRFPNGNYCFCDHCKAQFQQDTKIAVAHWPEDVQEGGPYVEQWQQWRRDLITSLAGEISEQCHKIKPGIFVSLAAWPDLNAARNEVGQDWTSWVKDGMLDFVCPMDYTESKDDLVNNQLAGQLDQVRGTIPFYPGLGAFLMKSPQPLIEQIVATREAGADGFLAFAYLSGDLEKWLPELHAAVTAGEPNPMPHWSPPAQFSFGGAAKAAPATAVQALAGAQLEVTLTLGLAPSRPKEDNEGAAQAADMIRRETERQTRAPTRELPEQPLPEAQQYPRISGRVVAEAPSGLALSVVGAFEGGSGVTRTLRFPALEGPFRVAVYGTVATSADQKREFVTRSILLTGIKPEAKPQAEGLGDELGRRGAEALAKLSGGQIAALTGLVQVHASGDQGGGWWFRLKDGKCEWASGEAERPDVTVTASAGDFRAIARGEASAKELWGAGRLTVSGDYDLVERLAQVFGYGGA